MKEISLGLGIAKKLAPGDLDGDLLVIRRILGKVDDGLTAGTEQSADSVDVTHGSADEKRSARFWLSFVLLTPTP